MEATTPRTTDAPPAPRQLYAKPTRTTSPSSIPLRIANPAPREVLFEVAGTSPGTVHVKADAPRARRLLAPNAFALGRIMKSTARSRDEEDERERQLAAKKLRELDAKQPRTF
ncbi:hypothetical protein SDRG_07509 [Saprolegnia diclina VS20]|uniref:Uncharacterized protein n=1 Tax=Saprolegnia diclina (strain VS20) TaxID=1156394 RepID=T0QBJ9_SAPDV|nr:hypothetical protein SDRG_07509 [Saprolegnia diclina VS20]EQC35284.1 hypothetical protein SDRG_07509 [Saprolegnia diclina VS20]|eukprot:XP_008611568.1 hypothetical protein SDRG_07509 [Saprolegnia diclina VS20]